MAVQTPPTTAEEFDRWVELPEHAGRAYEFVGGEIVEVVSNNYSSIIAVNIASEIRQFVKGKNLGYVTGADGGYRVEGERYIPDVAYISKARQPEPSHDAYNAVPPDLAVEVLSPTDNPRVLRFKLASYLAAGTTVWVVDPVEKTVEVYAPGRPPKEIGLDGTLDGGDALPGFALAVKDIFPE